MSGIYLHIPFCKRKCHYCNFFSVASLKQKDALIIAMKKELLLRKDYLSGNPISSIYFGGGTPSVLSYNEIELLLRTIYDNYKVDENAEITFEANPDDINKGFLRDIRKTGVNRFSIGVQSFFDEDLVYLNRLHDGQKAIDGVRLIQESGFDNITLDLIYGIPGLSREKWLKNLEVFFNLDVPHLSAYCLTVEPNTALSHFINKGKYKSPDEEMAITHFEDLLQVIENKGWQHYEISNFCKPGYYSRHNKSYWSGSHYSGIGPSAHSFDGESRQWNIAGIRSYIEGVNDDGVYFEREILDDKQKYNEYVMTSLRTMWGCEKEYLKKHFSVDTVEYLTKQIEPFISKGYVKETAAAYVLSKSGKLKADGIASDLFLEE